MTRKIDPQFNEWLLKERLQNSLAARFFLRFHASLLLLGAIATGWITSRLMYEAGVDSMLMRHVCAVLAAYVGFLLGLQLWIEYSGIKEYLNALRAQELLKGPIATRKKDEIDWRDGLHVPVADEGCAILVIVLVVLAALYVMGGYLIIHATSFFAEVVFELLLAAGLVRGVHKVDLLGTQGRVPLVTLWALALTLLAVVMFDLWAKHEFPQAKTMGDVVKAIRGK